MTITDYFISLVRTFVPIAVGALCAWLTSLGVSLDPSVAIGATAMLTGVFGGIYYALVRALEARFPFLGALLGHTAKPVYTKAAPKLARY